MRYRIHRLHLTADSPFCGEIYFWSGAPPQQQEGGVTFANGVELRGAKIERIEPPLEGN